MTAELSTDHVAMPKAATESLTHEVSTKSGNSTLNAPKQSTTMASLLTSMTSSLKDILTTPEHNSADVGETKAPLFNAEGATQGKEMTGSTEREAPVAQPFSNVLHLVQMLSKPEENEASLQELSDHIATAFEGTTPSQNLDKVLPLFQNLQGLMTEVFSSFSTPEGDLDAHVEEKMTAVMPKLKEFVASAQEQLFLLRKRMQHALSMIRAKQMRLMRQQREVLA